MRFKANNIPIMSVRKTDSLGNRGRLQQGVPTHHIIRVDSTECAACDKLKFFHQDLIKFCFLVTFGGILGCVYMESQLQIYYKKLAFTIMKLRVSKNCNP